MTGRNSDINELDIADGLKERLIEHDFDVERLVNTPPENIAKVLSIEPYIAKIIHEAAIRHFQSRIQGSKESDSDSDSDSNTNALGK